MFTGKSLFKPMPTLTTERLTLRRMTQQDAEDLFDYSKDPLVAQYVLWDAYTSVLDAKFYIRYMMRRYRAGLPSSWVIVENETHTAIGTIGYMWYQVDHNACEVGYSLARSRWNRGYMTEALRAVIAYSFNELKIHRIEAQHETENPSSGAVMRKCGMKKEGTLYGRLFNKGRYVDVDLYAILNPDTDIGP